MKHRDKDVDGIPAFHRDDDFGDWLHKLLMPEFGLETQELALEKVRKAQYQLQSSRPEGERYITEVLWIPDPTAFTAPGRYVYISRELLQRLPSEEQVAFVIAHEISHHDLGHIYTFHGQSIWRRLPGHAVLSGLLYHARRLTNSPRWESEADANGLKMCVRAGYDPQKCMNSLDILEMLMLDLNQIDVVFGPEDVLEEPLAGPLGRLKSEFHHWKWEHNLGYASLRDRKEALQAILNTDHVSERSAEAISVAPDSHTLQQRVERLARIDAGLERWHFGMVSVISIVTEVMRLPAYRLLTGRDGPQAPHHTGLEENRLDEAVTRFESIRHQLYLMMALLRHADSASQHIDSRHPDEQSLVLLEGLLATEATKLSNVDGGLVLRNLFTQQDALESGSLQNMLDEMTDTAVATREALLETRAA